VRRRYWTVGGGVSVAWLAACLIAAAPASAGTFPVYITPPTGAGCGLLAFWGSQAFAHGCPDAAGRLEVSRFAGQSPVPTGTNAGYQATAPPGISIIATQVTFAGVSNINNGAGWGGGSYWAGGGDSWNPGYPTTVNEGLFNSGYWGFQMVCGASSCANSGGISINALQFLALENTAPSLTAVGSNNLWYQAGRYVWNPPGDPWPLTLSGSDPSGVCVITADVNGHRVGELSSTPVTDAWHQCPDATWTPADGAELDTRERVPGDGPLSLQVQDTNAAGVQTTDSETLQVDNDPVQLSLSGPTTASTSAGTQYVTASASAGPSGVAIGCSVDGGPEQWQPGSGVQVPVAGAGDHAISCRARNGAVDPQGQPAYSASQFWLLNIGQPTVNAIGFAKLADALKCRHVRKHVIVPAHWVKVRRHHKLVRVRRRAHTKTIHVERCHARVVWRKKKVWVKVRRHGRLVSVRRTKRVRVVLIPHTVMQTKKRVAYGRGTTVSGWLGTAGGTAIGGAPVEILTAPNNGQGAFTDAATTTTAADGLWSAHLAPGPSRIVEAVYGGAAGLLPATSTPVELDVPARISLTARPRILPWSHVVTLRGHLVGGYVPPDGVALRLLIRLPHRKRPYEPVPFRTDGKGSFQVRWSWGTGSGVATYPFAVAMTSSESDYAFAASRSRWISVTFGRATPHHHHHHHRHRSKRRRK
jgi:hypothetical protein